MFPFFLDLSRIHAGVASSLKIASLTSVYNRIFTYETINKGKKFLSENFGEDETSGRGSLFKSLPFKSLPLSLENAYGAGCKNASKGRLDGALGKPDLGARLPEARQRERWACGASAMAMDGRPAGFEARWGDGATVFFLHKGGCGSLLRLLPCAAISVSEIRERNTRKGAGACFSRSASLVFGYRLLSPASSCFRDWIAEEA